MKLLITQRDSPAGDLPLYRLITLRDVVLLFHSSFDARDLNELSFVEYENKEQPRVEVSIRAAGSRDDFPVVVLIGQYFPDLKQEVY
jgi:hypothetical protein